MAWDGTVPAPLRPAATTAAPPCRAAGLKIDGPGFQFTPALSGGTGEMTLRNAGPAGCRLTGRPEVRVVGAVPAPAQQQLPMPAQPATFPAVVPPESALLSVLPGAAVTPWTSTVVQASVQPLPGGSVQLSGHRGEELRFAVELHNPSGAPVPFERCPLVVEMLAPAGAPEVHRLNCADAQQLPAGGRVRFEMRIRIPAGAPIGNNGLFWELDPTGARGPEVVSRVAVSAS